MWDFSSNHFHTYEKGCMYICLILYCVDLEVWSKLAKCFRIMCIASKCAPDFDCDWQHVNSFSHCITLIRVLLSQIISYSDTKVPFFVVMECKRANVIYVYELIFYSILQGQQSVNGHAPQQEGWLFFPWCNSIQFSKLIFSVSVCTSLESVN